MNSIVKSSVFIFLTALILPAYAATVTGVNGANNMATANQQEKSEPVKQKVAERHHYRHHHHHYYHRHHYCGYQHHSYGCHHHHTWGCNSGCNSCRTCANNMFYHKGCCGTNMFYHRGCCPTNVFYHGCGCSANKGCCAPNYY